jgi:hypothetical protein
LFGVVPSIEVHVPSTAAVFHQIPVRPLDFTKLGDKMTFREFKLLNSRGEVLCMDERQRTAAEKASSELMAWIEKSRANQVKLQDDNQTHYHKKSMKSPHG